MQMKTKFIFYSKLLCFQFYSSKINITIALFELKIATLIYCESAGFYYLDSRDKVSC